MTKGRIWLGFVVLAAAGGARLGAQTGAPQPPPRAEVVLPGSLGPWRIPRPPTNGIEAAGLQVLMERRFFSSGTIDGEIGMRTRKSLRAMQALYGLPVTGEFDAPTLSLLGEPEAAITRQALTTNDFAMVSPTPKLWREKAALQYLGYNTVLEMAAEKFHSTPKFMEKLNPGVLWEMLRPGDAVLAPDLTGRPEKPPKAAKLVVSLSELTIQALDAEGQAIAHFPCSIAEKAEKRPVGLLRVTIKVPGPDFTFNPEVHTKVAEAEGLTRKMMLPPGPNNPVGLAWISLSMPGYGIHGTPEPEDISRTRSLGCFRLANWNAVTILKMVDVGTPVEVIP